MEGGGFSIKSVLTTKQIGRFQLGESIWSWFPMELSRAFFKSDWFKTRIATKLGQSLEACWSIRSLDSHGSGTLRPVATGPEKVNSRMYLGMFVIIYNFCQMYCFGIQGIVAFVLFIYPILLYTQLAVKDPKIFTSMIWTVHFGYDNQGWHSFKRSVQLMKDTGRKIDLGQSCKI